MSNPITNNNERTTSSATRLRREYDFAQFCSFEIFVWRIRRLDLLNKRVDFLLWYQGYSASSPPRTYEVRISAG